MNEWHLTPMQQEIDKINHEFTKAYLRRDIEAMFTAYEDLKMQARYMADMRVANQPSKPGKDNNEDRID